MVRDVEAEIFVLISLHCVYGSSGLLVGSSQTHTKEAPDKTGRSDVEFDESCVDLEAALEMDITEDILEVVDKDIYE